MSEPMYLMGDSVALSSGGEATHSAECGECGQESEFPAYEEVQGWGRDVTVSWYAEWKCKFCGYPNTSEGWYYANDDN